MASLERRMIKAELKQRHEEGCDVAEIKPRVMAALEAESSQADLSALYDELMALPVADAFGYSEPSSLEDIRAERPDAPRKLDLDWDDETLYDRIYGAWLGRAAGCALGKPVEGWSKARIDDLLERTETLPLDYYFPWVERSMPKFTKLSTREHIRYMDRDDDLDFPILGLLALERKGAAMKARTIASVWMDYMPFGLVYTAENSAYRNFVHNILPPESAMYRNPFREWIGAQIRADIFGYAAPGWPEKAAELAYHDASISHDKNGVYGEMWVAAMLAATFVYTDIDDICNAGLAEIPANCRLAEAIRDTQAWCREYDDWEAVWDKIYENYGHYHGVHTINNAALVVLGLYFGEQDYEQGIVCSVRAGWDTDCNGATVGSILGLRAGAKALPEKWIAPLNDRLISAVREQNDNKISDLARRTLSVAERIRDGDKKGELPTATLSGDAAGYWDLDTNFGKMEVDFEAGKVILLNEDHGDFEYKITETAYQNPELKFTYAVDKGGWDYLMDFEGTLDGDRMEGTMYPGDYPVSGQRRADKQGTS